MHQHSILRRVKFISLLGTGITYVKLANELLFTLKLTSIFQSMNCQPILWFGIHFTHFLLVCIPHLVLHNLLNCKLVLCSDKWVFNHFQICMENRKKQATKEKYPLFELPPTAIHVQKQNWVLFTQISLKWHAGSLILLQGKKRWGWWETNGTGVDEPSLLWPPLWLGDV
jgi:hypothetical protein